ncbi:hypothetical protein LINPERHAP1_LOCUS20502, partial [Linum perenne]
ISSSEYDGSAIFLNLLLGTLGHELSLHQDWLVIRQDSLPKHLEVTELSHVDHRSNTAVLGGLVLDLLRNHRPQLVDVDDRAEEPVLQLVEVPHTDFTEVTGMVLVEQDPVVVHASGVTTTSRMLPVLANTSVAGTDVAPLLPVLLESGRHFLRRRIVSRGLDWRLGFEYLSETFLFGVLVIRVLGIVRVIILGLKPNYFCNEWPDPSSRRIEKYFLASNPFNWRIPVTFRLFSKG